MLCRRHWSDSRHKQNFNIVPTDRPSVGRHIEWRPALTRIKSRSFENSMNSLWLKDDLKMAVPQHISASDRVCCSQNIRFTMKYNLYNSLSPICYLPICLPPQRVKSYCSRPSIWGDCSRSGAGNTKPMKHHYHTGKTPGTSVTVWHCQPLWFGHVIWHNTWSTTSRYLAGWSTLQ